MTIFLIIVVFSILASFILIKYSTLKINIKEFQLVNKTIYKFNIEISLNLFNKVKWIRLKLDNEKEEGLKKSGKRWIINKILNTKILRDYKNIKGTVFNQKTKILEIIKKSKIEKFQLYAKIGTENPCATGLLTGFFSSFLAIILQTKITKPNFKIEPIYIDKNYIYLSINCIIAIKLVHIFNITRKKHTSYF